MLIVAGFDCALVHLVSVFVTTRCLFCSTRSFCSHLSDTLLSLASRSRKAGRRASVDSMEKDSGIKLSSLNVDGGMAMSKPMMQFQVCVCVCV